MSVLVELRERLVERGITPQRGGSGEDSATAGEGDQLEPLTNLSTDDLGDLIGGTQAAVVEMADASPLADEDQADDKEEEDEDQDNLEDLNDLEEDEE